MDNVAAAALAAKAPPFVAVKGEDDLMIDAETRFKAFEGSRALLARQVETGQYPTPGGQ